MFHLGSRHHLYNMHPSFSYTYTLHFHTPFTPYILHFRKLYTTLFYTFSLYSLHFHTLFYTFSLYSLHFHTLFYTFSLYSLHFHTLFYTFSLYSLHFHTLLHTFSLPSLVTVPIFRSALPSIHPLFLLFSKQDTIVTNGPPTIGHCSHCSFYFSYYSPLFFLLLLLFSGQHGYCSYSARDNSAIVPIALQTIGLMFLLLSRQ